MLDTLPRAITPRLLEFCQTISSQRPVFIPSKPTSDSQLGHCFDNVEGKIARAGGDVAYGWAIWHLRDLYFEAEHHGVWRRRDGVLVDVSPQANSYRKILFLPDSSAVYDPFNLRSNLFAVDSDSIFASEFFSLARRRTAIYDSYRAGGAKVAFISGEDQSELNQVVARMGEIIVMPRKSIA